MGPRPRLPPSSRGAALTVLAIAAVVVVSFLGVAPTGGRAQPATGPALTLTAGPTLGISSFGFTPNPVDVNSQTSGTVSLSGGTPGYFLWFNNTPPGCSPSSSPLTTSSPTYQFNCQVSSTGDYTIHLDVLDSSVPVEKASTSTTLNVVSNNNNNNNGNGNNSNGGGNGSIALPSGLLQLALIAGIVFFVSMFLIAAGTIATAVLVSRRLRQINETLTKLIPPPKGPTPPT